MSEQSSVNMDAEKAARTKPLAWEFVRLVRPTQWAKSIFVLVGPAYHYLDPDTDVAWHTVAIPALLAAAIFACVSSSLYILNDILDVERDRAHPRKRKRPIASGAVTPSQGRVLGAVLVLIALGMSLFLHESVRWIVLLWVAFYALNVTLYSYTFKRKVILDVVSLSVGFVVRVLAGCAAVAISPTTWLLNCVFFGSMFLAFGKRLGERKTTGDAASAVRGVQKVYTDELLRMSVVVTGVAALLTYAMYIQEHELVYGLGFNLLWLTLLPATYGMLRSIVLLETGTYDDPTELATHDRGVQAAVAIFGAMTGVIVLIVKFGVGG